MDVREVKFNINIYRRYYHWKKAKCIYIHVPKVAGTSINNALYGKTLGHYTCDHISKTFSKLYQESFKFSFVRNPWDRLVSAYRFARIGNTGVMGIRNPNFYQDNKFDNFETFVNEWLIYQDLDKLDFVFQPQSRFVKSKSKFTELDFIGKIENIDNELINLNHHIGKNIKLNRENATSSSTYYKNFYTKDVTIDNVLKIYNQDITNFSYQF